MAQTNEMIIALKKGSYIRPHMHPYNKSGVLSRDTGKMDVYIFREMEKNKSYPYG